MTDKLATIIVVTHNSARWLAALSAALMRQHDKRWALIVVDNASEADQKPTTEALPPGAQLIENKTNIGFAAANNQAAGQASTPFLVFLNPDAFPEPDWFGKLIDLALAQPDAGAIGSTQVRAGDESRFDGTGDVMHASGLAYRSSYGKKRKTTPPLGESFAACAAAMLVRKRAFEACSGFDERYFCFFEDIDLCFRMRLLGWRILQSPEAVVAHVGGGASTAAFADYHGARNRVWTFMKCMPAALFWPLLPAHLLANTLAAITAFCKGRGWAALAGFIAGLMGSSQIWADRRALQKMRVASVAAVAGALAWAPWLILTRQPVIRPLRQAPRRGAQVPPQAARPAPVQPAAPREKPPRDRTRRARSDPS